MIKRDVLLISLTKKWKQRSHIVQKGYPLNQCWDSQKLFQSDVRIKRNRDILSGTKWNGHNPFEHMTVAFYGQPIDTSYWYLALYVQSPCTFNTNCLTSKCLMGSTVKLRISVSPLQGLYYEYCLSFTEFI